MCQRQEAVEEICPCSLIVDNLRVKTDGSKKEVYMYATSVPLSTLAKCGCKFHY